MLDSISIAQSGLLGFQQGLRAIANNTANINTPGFKGATTKFADLFYGNSALSGNGGFGQFGYGLNTLGTTINFGQGTTQGTGRPLDLAIEGQGFFTLRDTNGNLHYTQDGQFKWNSDDILVSVSTGEEVMAMDVGGQLTNITKSNFQMNGALATSTVTFSGNLSTAATAPYTISSVTVIDAAGSTHKLSVTLAQVAGTPGSWTVTLLDGATTVGTGNLVFVNGQPVPGSTIAINYAPAGVAPIPLTLDFSNNVTSYDSGQTSTINFASQNGHVVGSLQSETFDETGTLVLTYSNGQTVRGRRLALAQFRSDDDVEALGNNSYGVKNRAWSTGFAGVGQFGKISSSRVEMSNVDLSQEFSNLVVMQRGYQACSQVVSTASDMLNTLYGMWSK